MIFSYSVLSITSSSSSLTAEYSKLSNTETLFTTKLLITDVYSVDHKNLLNQSTRFEIYSYVLDNPGVYFRDICRNLGKPVGVVQYHLQTLTSAGLLASFRDGRYKRYFETGRFNKKEIEAISILKHETAGKILRFLYDRRSIPHTKLARELNISSQALTWQIKRLKELGFVESESNFNRIEYYIPENKELCLEHCFKLIN